MNKPQIHVDGIAPLVKALQRSGGEDTLEALRRANAEAAGVIHATAATMVPVRTGRLARTLRGSATPKQGAVRVGTKAVPYAGPIHFGWRAHGIEPQPFLYGALDARRDQVVQAYARSIMQLARDFNRGGK